MVVSNAPPTKLFFDMSNREAKQAGKKPWLVRQNYLLDILTMKYRTIRDGVLKFEAPSHHANDKRERIMTVSRAGD